MTARPDDTATDLHAVIAELRAEREAGLAREARLAEELAARTAQLAEHNSEFGELLEQQAATIHVEARRPSFVCRCVADFQS